MSYKKVKRNIPRYRRETSDFVFIGRNLLFAISLLLIVTLIEVI